MLLQPRGSFRGGHQHVFSLPVDNRLLCKCVHIHYILINSQHQAVSLEIGVLSSCPTHMGGPTGLSDRPIVLLISRTCDGPSPTRPLSPPPWPEHLGRSPGPHTQHLSVMRFDVTALDRGSVFDQPSAVRLVSSTVKSQLPSARSKIVLYFPAWLATVVIIACASCYLSPVRRWAQQGQNLIASS